MAREFFYDNQIRRFILQFVRMFSNFQVEIGAPDSSGNRDMLTVPVMYGDLSRNVAQIMREASENKVLSAPRMSCYINQLQYQRERIQEPNFIDKLHVAVSNNTSNPAVNSTKVVRNTCLVYSSTDNAKIINAAST